ncbi:MAG: phytanoyl-CoA dioxygenase family protein, partial [Candidatus Sumerlaeaceae bacterium]
MSVSAVDLPRLDSKYGVSSTDSADYQKNGHILLRGVASPVELDVYHPVIGTATGRHNTEKRDLKDRDTYGKAFLQVMNLWRHDEGVKQFTLARRFAQIAADLMGVNAVRLYHDQALYK